MSLLTHIDHLKAKHIDLEKTISQEYSRPLPNDQVIAHMKHQKLLLKQEIQQLASQDLKRR